MSKPEKDVTLSQTDKIWTTYRNQYFSSGPEKRDSTVLVRQKRKSSLTFSETPQLRRKNWARQDTRESLTTLELCGYERGHCLIEEGCKSLFFFFFFGHCRIRMGHYPSKTVLGIIRLRILNKSTPCRGILIIFVLEDDKSLMKIFDEKNLISGTSLVVQW